MRKLIVLLLFSTLGSTAAHAQNNSEGYDLLFETPPKYRLITNLKDLAGEMAEVTGYSDMTGDGVDDLVTWRVDDDGIPIELVVFDMVTRTRIWNWTADEAEPFVGNTFPEFIGFFDIDHDGPPLEPLFIFSGDGVPPPEVRLMILDPVAKTPEFDLLIKVYVAGVIGVLVGDFNGDGFDELGVANSDTDTFQIWGNDGKDNAAARKRRR